MSQSAQYETAWSGVENSYKNDRLAHAYLIVGSPRGVGLELAQNFLRLLFCKNSDTFCGSCPACDQIIEKEHADIFWIEPQSKSRIIKADEVRNLIHRMEQTSFEGGWKAGIVLAADRMNTNSQNALLKTLEEPPSKSILLLVTDAPQQLLPTIVSRCQKLVLTTETQNSTDASWRGPLMNLLNEMPPRSGLGATGLAGRVHAILSNLEKELSNEEKELLPEELTGKAKEELLDGRVRSRLLEMRHEIIGTIQSWHRDILAVLSGAESSSLLLPAFETEIRKQSQLYSIVSAINAVQQIEVLSEQLERIARRDQMVLEACFRKMVVRR